MPKKAVIKKNKSRTIKKNTKVKSRDSKKKLSGKKKSSKVSKKYVSVRRSPQQIIPVVSPAPSYQPQQIIPSMNAIPSYQPQKIIPAVSPAPIAKIIKSSQDCEKKEFLILHVLDDAKGEKALTVKKQTCYSDYPIEYEEIYIPINANDLEQKQDLLIAQINKLSVFCAGLLIKIPNTNTLSILKFLRQLKLPNYSSIYTDESPSNVRNAHTFFPDVKVYQLIKKESTLDYTLSNIHYYIVKKSPTLSDLLFFEDPNSITQLECTPWFQHFLDRSFYCVYGRLKQLSGTCYLNAVLNGLFLSPTMRLLLREKYEQMKHVANVDETITFNKLACPMPQTKQSLPFIMTLVNLLIIKKEKMTAGDLDIIKEASMNVYGDQQGDGGFSRFALFLTLKNLNLSYAFGYQFKNTFIFNDVDLDLQLRKAKVLFGGPLKNKTPDFFLIVFMGEEDVGRKWKSRLANFNNEDYILLFGLVSSEAHAMVGIFCDGRPQVYDSNNYIYDYNWLQFDKEKFEKVFKKFEKLEICYIFIKKSLADSLHAKYS